MAETTKIEWADKTWSPWIGCQKVGPGCDHCYAESLNKRTGGGNWGPGAPRRRTSEAYWKQPAKWNKAGPATVFPSLCDPFDNAVHPDWRSDLFKLINETPNLTWLLLTKRIGNVQRMLRDDGETDHLPPNAWLGATIVNRDEMLRDAPKLKEAGARVKFWSYEPALGDLGVIPPELLPDWVICGGESGSGARPMHPDWARSLRDQCAAAGVPFLFKQWGEWAAHRPVAGGNLGGDVRAGRVQWVNRDHHTDAELLLRSSFPGGRYMARVGKKAAGRLLDGVQHDGFPA